MRRIAAELGAGTMTLYHYVRTKGELVALMRERIMGELIVPDDELADDWREGLAQLARRTRDVLVRHPWIVRHIGEEEGDPAGPNFLRHVEQSLAVASRMGLPIERQFEVTAFVDDYVFGHVLRQQDARRARNPEGVVQRKLGGMAQYLDSQLRTGEYPHLEAFAGDDPAGAFQRLAELAGDVDRRFERGLQLILDGIAREIKQQAADSR